MGQIGGRRLLQEDGSLIEAPQGFVVAEECRKATWQNGYRRPIGEHAGWAAFGSTTAKGTVHLAACGAQGPWYLGLDHPGVITELGSDPLDLPGPGFARFAFHTLGALYAALGRVYELGVSLPNGPLEAFVAATKDLPKAT